MVTPPQDRVEIVLMADQPAPFRLWAQSPAQYAKRYEYGKDKSIRVLGAIGCVLLMLLAFFPAATVLIALASLIVLFPLSLVGMTGFSRGG